MQNNVQFFKSLWCRRVCQSKIHNTCNVGLFGLKCTYIDSLYHGESFILSFNFREETQRFV